MKDKTCSLLSFSAFLKAFDLRRHADQMCDARTDPEISPASVFLALFHAFAFRLPSFQQLDTELAHSYLQNWIGAERAFHDDVLRYSLCSFNLEPLEQMLVETNRRLKRRKALDPGRVQGRLVAALDGVEVLSSYSRCCESCLQRRVTLKDETTGQSFERIQYYHRAVGCQIVSSPVKPFLAMEWLRPGEGEDTAALRLLARLPKLYGSRFFDILLLDSLYAQAPLLRLAKQIGWEVVISLKQENRDLYQDALGLFQSRGQDQTFTDQQPGKTYVVCLWQEFGLPFSQDHPQPMRVVRTQEKLSETHYRGQQKRTETSSHEWMWMTTLTPTFPAPLVRRLGHDRWKNENNGWMDLTQHWAFKHGFLHACRHRPQRRHNPSGKPEPVPNSGLAAVSLILLIAFALCSAFVLRHSKLARLHHLSAVAVAAQLRSSAANLLPAIRAPT
jgi:hypothetical protein